MKQKRTVLAGTVAIVIAASTVVSAAPANADATADGSVLGGWSETQGPVPRASIGTRATVNHRGTAERRVIGGTTHKRSHGWTTWSGVRHYTTARLEHTWPASGVIATSGRKWGTGGTEAVTGWKRFDPNATSSGYGSARTYYGR